MNQTTLSSLDRFSNSALVTILDRSRRMRRQLAEQHGRDHALVQGEIQYTYAVVTVMKGRGMEIPAYAG